MIENLGHSLRHLRESHHMSLKLLAEQAGFSASFLSQVENGRASPSISTMERIATALGVTLGQFFNHAEASHGSVIRHDDRASLNLDWSLSEIESAGALDSGSKLYAFLVKMRAGGLSGKHPRPSTNDEFAFVYHGEVKLTWGNQIMSWYQVIRPSFPLA